MTQKDLLYYNTETQQYESPYARISEVTAVSDRLNQHLVLSNYQEITPQNGWQGGLLARKDAHNNLQVIIVLNGGVTQRGTILGILPQELIPQREIIFAATSVGDVDNIGISVGISINADGELRLNTTARNYLEGSTMIYGGL